MHDSLVSVEIRMAIIDQLRIAIVEKPALILRITWRGVLSVFV